MIAFYAAVHYVNAYLWESRRFAPTNHYQRRAEILADPSLLGCGLSYRALQDNGFYARYAETFSLSEQAACGLVEVDLRLVEATVLQALGQPVPVW